MSDHSSGNGSSPFDYSHFRAAIFAAFVRQDMTAVGNALALLQDVTGTSVVEGCPTPAEVEEWAQTVCNMLQKDADYLDEHGEVHPRLRCHNPKCGTHGVEVRARLARAVAVATPAPRRGARGRLFVGPPVPGVH